MPSDRHHRSRKDDHRSSRHRDDDRRDRYDEDRDRRSRQKSSRSRKSHSRSRSPVSPRNKYDKEDSPEEKPVDLTKLLTQNDRLKAQQELELMFMRKREKVEQERQAKKRKEYNEEKEKAQEKKEEVDIIDDDDELAERAFEDDDQDMEVEVTKDESDDEVDPLDAYMATIEKQVKPAEIPITETKEGVIVVDEEIKPGRNLGEIMEREDAHEGIEAEDFDIEAAANQLLAKGRSLPKTDHEKVYYKAFKKNFYHEAQAIKEMTKKEVEKFREDNEGIRVRGSKCPKPILSWAHAGVSKTEMKILQK